MNAADLDAIEKIEGKLDTLKKRHEVIRKQDARALISTIISDLHSMDVVTSGFDDSRKRI